MRLYLSSYRFGDHAVELVSLMRGGRRACVIGNALDYIPAEERLRYAREIHDPIAEFASLGVEAEALDLRTFFSDSSALDRSLRGYDLVWVLGGNAFLLRRAMAQSGFDACLRELLSRDALVYGGFSAGAVAATPTLRGIESMDDPYQLADGYCRDPVWDGLGLVDFSLVPHFQSDHAEAPAAAIAARYFVEQGMPFKALRDGEVWKVDGSVQRLLVKTG